MRYLLICTIPFFSACQQVESVRQLSSEALVDHARLVVDTTLPTALTNYYARKREFPERLEVLVEQKRIMPEQIVDPWSTPYRYEPGTVDFKLCSAGPDKQFGGPDDICHQAKDGAR